jgi:catalase (peroxidase I)
MDVKDQKKIIDICQSLVSGDIHIVDGCRELVSLRNQLNLQDDPNFLPFVGVVSETDDYPEPSVQEKFSSDYLKLINKDMSDYIALVRPSVIDASNILISKYMVR